MRRVRYLRRNTEIGIVVQPGRYYHGSVERRTTAPPCSFFAAARGLASRFIYEPGKEGYEIARWILPAQLTRPALFINQSAPGVYEALQAAIESFLPKRETHYEADWGWAFCQARDELFPGYQGIYHNLGGVHSLLVADPAALMRYGRPRRAPTGRHGIPFKKIGT